MFFIFPCVFFTVCFAAFNNFACCRRWLFCCCRSSRSCCHLKLKLTPAHESVQRKTNMPNQGTCGLLVCLCVCMCVGVYVHELLDYFVLKLMLQSIIEQHKEEKQNESNSVSEQQPQQPRIMAKPAIEVPLPLAAQPRLKPSLCY